MRRYVPMIVLLVLCLSRPAWPFEPGETTFFLMGELGVGGEVGLEFEFEGQGIPKQGIRGSEDFTDTIGVGLWLDYSFSDAVAFGGEVRVLWWNGKYLDKDAVDRSMFVELCPSLRLGVDPTPRLSLYIRLAPGFSILALNEDFAHFASEASGTNVHLSPGFGFNIGGFSGLNVKYSDNIGFVIEFGYIYHMMFGSIDFSSTKVGLTIDGGQTHMNIGLSF